MSVQIIKKAVKHINIRVKPNQEVILTAPLKTTDEHIAFVLNKRASWIDEKIAFYKEYQDQKPKEYVSGEGFKYLGRQYRLKVIEGDTECVKLQKGFFYLYVKDRDNLQRKKRVLNNWYRDKADEHFQKILKRYQTIVQLEVTNVRVREMRTRWGSCNPAKSFINLNSELIKKPRYCIEYVIFHELAHLIYPNHSREFYNYLTLHMPDWKKRKSKLESTV